MWLPFQRHSVLAKTLNINRLLTKMASSACYLLSIKSSRGDAGYDLRQAMLEENIGDNDIPIGREDAWHE